MKDNPIRTPGIQSELALSSEFKRRAEIQYKWSSEDGDALKTPHGGPDPTRCYRPQGLHPPMMNLPTCLMNLYFRAMRPPVFCHGVYSEAAKGGRRGDLFVPRHHQDHVGERKNSFFPVAKCAKHRRCDPALRDPGVTVTAPSASSCCHRIIGGWVTRQTARDLISSICESEKSRASMGTDLSAWSYWSFTRQWRGPRGLWVLTVPLWGVYIMPF
ncbi:uncharacterized protein LOC130203938 [Pseudoliparis swirei]|uniref:uncharacterized protein LOC130203938 n=1 Tax=Pseudoliparis swirei TaxID=2059687 RepID=UPI0024BEF0C2|nr:uncharacterized protein LOC130203938 [Pseudoliparis swirei]